ncbi:CRISPR-associated endoribonuclease Cas6 [uncultured Clostridium sp.]|uniref:CRISPR-associated endoribonuclease Cas6 n=1 Tax=uncultured Clostridium sp. TaxID=59620 RepID=UPI0028EC8054|nr:CRISPR-associated endoribonuclease Cas6 [uncultured Clostridium sp.]
MTIKELTILVKLKKTVKYQDIPELLTSVLNSCFLQSNKYKELHESHHFKYYCFSCLYPTEKSGAYLANEIYSFKLRTLNFELADMFTSGLINYPNDLFILLNIDTSIKNQLYPIKSLYTVTPAVITEGNRNWDKKELNDVKKKIIRNTTRKYKYFMGLNIDDYEFIEEVKMLNTIPIVFNYKGGKLLSNKFLITLKQDRFSQELAFMLLGAGLLEKNSLSFGFCTIGKERP